MKLGDKIVQLADAYVNLGIISESTASVTDYANDILKLSHVSFPYIRRIWCHALQSELNLFDCINIHN